MRDLLGANTSNFTATSELFLKNDKIKHWRFEVTYSAESQTSTSMLSFQINDRPANGNCSIKHDDSQDRIGNQFIIRCFGWIDEHDIRDYAVYGKSKEEKDQSY